MKLKLIILLVSITTAAYANSITKPELPPFLPQYYSPAFQIGQNNINLFKRSVNDNVEQWIYTTQDQSLWLNFEYIKCEHSAGKAIFRNIIRNINKEIGENKGEFLKITDRELHCQVVEPNISKNIFAYILPGAIEIWTFSTTPEPIYSAQKKFEEIKSIVNKHRYCEAMIEGNVSMGIWDTEIHEYASDLLQGGKKKEAVSVLKNLLATSPYNYKAHWDFLTNSDDTAAISTSTKIIFDNAEDSELVSKVTKLRGKEFISFESIPILDKNETGLQVILVPLMPCRLWLLEDVAQVYEETTGIPVKIRRLKEQWKWFAPERIAHQRAVQKMLIGMKGENIDFIGWTKDRYIEQLRNLAEKEDALTRYYIEDVIKKIHNDPPQYLASPYVDNLCNRLEKYRLYDKQTMYVGITENNIYGEDTNYIFSLSTMQTGSGILSYYMMLASTLEEDYESRKRLTERIAKELVPASLKQLGIPRSTDPRCPYSYSSGVGRLDEKTLKLSDTLVNYLRKIKEPKK